jgi:hypothetical protein
MPRRSPNAKGGRATTPGERAEKICARCGRPFSWRRKWARDWEQVRYCSDRCRMGKAAGELPTP